MKTTREQHKLADLIDAITCVPVKTEKAACMQRGVPPIIHVRALKNESAIDVLNAIHSAGYKIVRAKTIRKIPHRATA